MTRSLSVRRCALLAIVAIPLAIALLVAKRAVDIPYWDEWEWADLVYKMHVGTLQFADVWTQHSEHRMLFPNLIMLGLARFGGWHPVREQFASLTLLVLCQAMIYAMIRRSARSTIGVIGSLMATLLLYGVWQWENLNWGFQTAWFLCNTAAIAVVYLLARPHRRPLHVGLAIAIAAIGSYSSSQGLVIWAVGAVALMLSGRRVATMLGIWIPAALVAYFIYRHGMFPVDTGHVNIIAHPFLAARYICAYLGSPLARWLGATGSEFFGALAVAAVVYAFATDVRSKSRTRLLARSGCWYALAVFPIVCAVATSSGRAGFGIDQALASRYTTISGLLWVCLVGLAVARFGRQTQPFVRGVFERLALAGLAFGLMVGASSFAGANEWKSTAALLEGARAELIASDPAALPKIYPDSQREIMLMGELRAVHDGLFAP